MIALTFSEGGGAKVFLELSADAAGSGKKENQGFSDFHVATDDMQKTAYFVAVARNHRLNRHQTNKQLKRVL